MSDELDIKDGHDRRDEGGDEEVRTTRSEHPVFGIHVIGVTILEMWMTEAELQAEIQAR